MRLLSKALAHLLFLLGMLVFILLPSNEYSWMQELDPSMSQLPADNAADNRAMFTLILLILIAASQLAVAALVSRRLEKVVSLVLVLVAASAWWLRFGS